MDFSERELKASRQVHADNPGEINIRSLTWFLPEFQHAYYGGIYTLLRFADYLTRKHGVSHRFMVLGRLDPALSSEKIAASFPKLGDFPVNSFREYDQIQKLEATDAAIASLWATSYFLLRFNQTKRKFYFIQDYEPLFYPAGSIFAQIEASYRFGFYGIANTPTIKQVYEDQYGGSAHSFFPCVDTDIFYPGADIHTEGNRDGPLRLFFYGRPGHPRNGFELGAQALRILKKRLGKRLEVFSAGDVWTPRHYDLHGLVMNLGLLEYRQTADLYRTCHAGLVMMFTRHPSYLPLELMASGSLVVTNYNPATSWLLQDGENCRLSEASATSLADVLEESLVNSQERRRITSNALCLIRERYSDWDCEMEKVDQYMRSSKDSHADRY
jgi:O-antigen biosynthesis protein